MGRKTTLGITADVKEQYEKAKSIYNETFGVKATDNDFIKFLVESYLEAKEFRDLAEIKKEIERLLEAMRSALSTNTDYKKAFYDVLDRMKKLEEENAKLKTELDLKVKEIEELKSEIVKLKTSAISTTSRKELLSKALFEYAQLIRSNYSNYIDIYSEFIDLMLTKVFIDDDRVDVEKIESIVNCLMW